MGNESIVNTDLIAQRDYLESDKNFIFSTVLRGLYYDDSWFSEIPKNIFMENYHPIVEAMLASPRNHVRVACLKDDPEVILGYSILSRDGTRCHFVFVKAAWRKVGIAKSLIPPTVTTVSHLTALGRSLARKKNLEFNPFVIV